MTSTRRIARLTGPGRNPSRSPRAEEATCSRTPTAALVVYASDNAATGDFDILISARASGLGTPIRLELSDAPGSSERNPTISGTLPFRSNTHLPERPTPILYVYDTATDTLLPLPATPDIDEHLNDISMLPDGTVHVAWARRLSLVPTATTCTRCPPSNLPAPSYQVCPLSDTSRSVQGGESRAAEESSCAMRAARIGPAASHCSCNGAHQDQQQRVRSPRAGALHTRANGRCSATTRRSAATSSICRLAV